jgi:hypothetical protein
MHEKWKNSCISLIIHVYMTFLKNDAMGIQNNTFLTPLG